MGNLAEATAIPLDNLQDMNNMGFQFESCKPF